MRLLVLLRYSKPLANASDYSGLYRPIDDTSYLWVRWGLKYDMVRRFLDGLRDPHDLPILTYVRRTPLPSMLGHLGDTMPFGC